jgi:hypothetical protein
MSKSSIDFYEQRIYDIEFAFTQGVFDNNEYQSRKSEALKEAKEMEKQQRMSDFTMGVTNANRMEATKDAEKWFNETYGGNNV